ncbi:MAG: SlyX family protein [Devosia sp.]
MAEPPASDAARLEALEIRAAYQERTIEELNAVLAEQWKEIERLGRELRLLEAELREALAGLAETPGEEPPPPHY